MRLIQIQQKLIIPMFLGRDLSREDLKKQMNGHLLRACTSQKRITVYPSLSEYSSVGPYRYREQDLIGKGFSSRVYKASHINQGNEVYAIKVINLSKFKSSNLQMLQHEIEVHRVLNHPNIVKFYDAFKTQNFYYIITEYCPHGDLSSLLNRKRKIEEEKSFQIICQVISGYLYLSKKGILHRDLKPANIIKHGNTWKIGDFGFSTFCKTDYFFDKLNVGTPLYMPPESLKTNKYSFKSDIFALGIILYELLNGKTPWDCKTEKQLISKMMKQKIKFPTNPQEKIVKFIERACSVNQYERMSRQQLATFLMNNNCNPEEKQNNQGNQKNQEKKQDRKKNDEEDKKKQKEKQKTMLKYCGSTPKLGLVSSPKKIQKNSSYKSIRQDQSSTEISEESCDKIPNQGIRPNSSTLGRKISNTEFLLRELQFCRLIYYMIKNIKYFPLSEKKKNFMELALFKHLLRCIKQLEDPAQYFSDNLIGFTQYKSQRQYQNLHGEIKNYAQRYQKEYLDTLKNTDILVIRSVNRTFSELSYTHPFSKKFYQEFYDYLCCTIRQCNHQIAIKLKDIQKASQFQALESLFIYSQIVKEKTPNNHNETSYPKSYLLGLGNKIAMDYGRSKLTKIIYQQLREKLKNL